MNRSNNAELIMELVAITCFASLRDDVTSNDDDKNSNCKICYVPNLPKVQPTDTPPPSSLIRFIMMGEIDKSMVY